MAQRLLILIFAFILYHNARTETPLWEKNIALIPYPQQATLTSTDFIFDDAVKLVGDENASPADSFAARDLAERLETEWGVAFSSGDNAAGKKIILTRRNAAPRIGDQGYELVVNGDSIVIRAHSEAGLFWGTRTFLQVLQKRNSVPLVKGVHIVDWPDIPVRAVHYDTKHHQDKKAYVKAFIRTLADYKINMLIWEWEDKFAYKSHPEIGAPGAFTMQEMQEFTHYARRYHIQIVPLVQGLGHVSYILKWPQYAHLREIPASNWEFCPRKKGSYNLLFDLFDEAIQATPGSQYLHIGTDETFELGLGVACGCKARAQEVGRYGLMLDFIDRCADHVQAQGRQTISWGGEYRANEKRTPPQGLIVSELTDDLQIAKSSREAGYPAWVYDPNPGIEHLFLPYLYRIRDGQVTDGCLQSSFNRLSAAAQSGLFDGMVCTSWDDSGLHNQMWMMRFVNAAEYAWSGAHPSLPEFQQKYFINYYGRNARDLAKLWRLLNDGAYYYMDTFERKVWHWGYVGKTHLPDLPRGDAVEYDPFWNREYSDMIERSRVELQKMNRAQEIIRANIEAGMKHSYDFEVFASVAELIGHTCRTYLMLSELEHEISRAHQQRFIDLQQTSQALQNAVAMIEDNLADRERVFDSLVRVWEKTRLPKGLSTADKKYFHRQDRARHFANRRAEMSYLIYDEQLLDLEGYLKKLRDYSESPLFAAQKSEQSVETFCIVLPTKATSVLRNIASVMERQISQRCNARPASGDSTLLRIELMIDHNLGEETFRIADGQAGVIRIIGGDERGVLYGVGKFLRTSRYDRDGFTPGLWRGTSAPGCPVRAVYLATHFGNFYESAPTEEVTRYIQDLGLWGYNTIFIAYPPCQYDGPQDAAARRWIERFRVVLAGAQQCGLQVGLMECANQGYKSTPAALRATPVPGNRRGNFGVNLCPSKPEARKLLLRSFDNLLDQFTDIGMDYYVFWPYDEGGCACNLCRPWGARGYLNISRDLSKLVHKKFPNIKIVLSTWCYENENDDNPDGEWIGLEASLRRDKSWVNYIMADGHDNYFPKYILEQGVPGNLPLLNFPEISMFGMSPWGGYGANPAPGHFQMLWNRIRHKAAGGAPYSEGIYEDINKVIIAGFYWDPERKAKDSVREYLSFEFSPDVADDLLEAVRIFEQNHKRNNIHDSAIRAFELVSKAQGRLTPGVRSSWRWRIFYLRALIDKELYQRKGKLEGKKLKAAFAELTRLYHAEHAHSMPIKPPEIR